MDALVLAYRCELDPRLLGYLQGRRERAQKHGLSSFEWPPSPALGAPHLSASLKWIANKERYLLTSEPHVRVLVCPKVARVEGVTDDGQKIEQPGWTLELVWYAQELARRELGDLLREGRELAELFGVVYEARLRRIDLCADVAGVSVRDYWRRRLDRRPRSRWSQHDMIPSHPADEVEGDGPVESYANAVAVTGLRVGRGDVVSRWYDKPRELALERNEDKREDEWRRWRERGWDGDEPVTRFEWQLRGAALVELGIRSVEHPYDPETGLVYPGGLVGALDRVWKTCLRWSRLVVRQRAATGALKPVSRCPDAPLWKLLAGVIFHHEANAPIRRRRLRGPCSAAQGLGCMLGLLGRRHLLAPHVPEPILEVDAAQRESLVREAFRAIALAWVDEAAKDACARWGRDAMDHVRELAKAAVARSDERPIVTWIDAVTSDGVVFKERIERHEPSDAHWEVDDGSGAEGRDVVALAGGNRPRASRQRMAGQSDGLSDRGRGQSSEGIAQARQSPDGG